MQSTNNQAHQAEHPLVKNKIKFDWKVRIGKGLSKKNPNSSQPVIDEEYIYTIDTDAKVSSIGKKNGKIDFHATCAECLFCITFFLMFLQGGR